MPKKYRNNLQLMSLLGLLALMSPPLAADPLGYLVNKVMESIVYGQDSSSQTQQSTVRSFRTIPANSKPGTLSPIVSNAEIEISGDDFLLASNSRIRDEANRIIHTGMVKQEKRVRYTLNANNQVDRIWILAPGEQ